MPDLHDRLTQIIREAWHRSRAWTPGVQLPAEEFADALLASEEWQAREADVKALAEALEIATRTIRVWSEMGAREPEEILNEVWQLYQNSPEMKQIRAALARLNGIMEHDDA